MFDMQVFSMTVETVAFLRREKKKMEFLHKFTARFEGRRGKKPEKLAENHGETAKTT